MNRTVTVVGLVVLAAIAVGTQVTSRHAMSSLPGLSPDLHEYASRALDYADAVSDSEPWSFQRLYLESPARTRRKVIDSLQAAVSRNGSAEDAALLALVLLEAERRGDLDLAQGDRKLPLVNSVQSARLERAYPGARIPTVEGGDAGDAAFESPWARDTLEIREAELAGDSSRAGAARARIAARAESLSVEGRMLRLLRVALAVIGLALAALLVFGWIATPRPTGLVDLGPSAWEGVGVFVRAIVPQWVVPGAVLFAVSVSHVLAIAELPMLSMLAGSIVALLYLRWLLSRIRTGLTLGDLLGPSPGVGVVVAWALALYAASEILWRVTGSIDQALPMSLGSRPVLAAAPNFTPSWVQLVAELLAGVLVGPFLEELLFRGLLFGSLCGALGFTRAALLAGVAFTSGHVRSVGGHLHLVAFGVLYALVYRRTGTLRPLVLAHALNNLVSFAGRL